MVLAYIFGGMVMASFAFIFTYSFIKANEISIGWKSKGIKKEVKLATMVIAFRKMEDAKIIGK